MLKTIFLIFIVVCFNILPNSNGQRTKDSMYEPINGISACFRRMNGTHQIGCSSKREGSTGVIHFIEKSDGLDQILNADNNLKYIPVIPVSLFTKQIADELQKSPKITGLIVYEKNETLEYYTHEETCPNKYSNVEGTCNDNEWNTHGTGLLRESFRFPIFYVNEPDDIKKIQDCFQKFNNFDFINQGDRSLCSLELQGFMYASIDTPTCIRRSGSNLNLNPVKLCDPLGDQNIWASLFPIGNSTVNETIKIKPDMKYIILAARLDTTSMFNDYAPGAINPITALVTLLSIADLLKRMMPDYADYDKNVLFLLFHGETYDYLGSQRILYDMEMGEFPTKQFRNENESIPNIGIDDISLFIELNQLSQTDKLFIHKSNDNEEIREFITKLKKYKKGDFNINETPGIPPASFQTFLKARPNISGIVFADHDKQYVNLFYNSMYDNSSNIKYTYLNGSYNGTIDIIPRNSVQEYVKHVTEMIASSLYEEISRDAYKGSEIADIRKIDELFYCYLQNANCTIHQAIQRMPFTKKALSLYVGVNVSPNYLTKLIGLTLAWFTGTVVETEDGPCYKNMSSYVYNFLNMSANLDQLNVTKCFLVSLNFTEALSPAFVIEDYDFKSGKYSSWSESVWKEFNLRLFLKPSRTHEAMTMAVGSAVFIFATAFIYFVHKKASLIFEPSDVSPTSC